MFPHTDFLDSPGDMAYLGFGSDVTPWAKFCRPQVSSLRKKRLFTLWAMTQFCAQLPLHSSSTDPNVPIVARPQILRRTQIQAAS